MYNLRITLAAGASANRSQPNSSSLQKLPTGSRQICTRILTGSPLSATGQTPSFAGAWIFAFQLPSFCKSPGRHCAGLFVAVRPDIQIGTRLRERRALNVIARASSSVSKGGPKWPGKHRKSSKCPSEWKSTCTCAPPASKRRANCEAEPRQQWRGFPVAVTYLAAARRPRVFGPPLSPEPPLIEWRTW